MFIAELVPHFEQSDEAFIGYPAITDAYEKFDLELSFKPEATDGQTPFRCFDSLIMYSDVVKAKISRPRPRPYPSRPRPRPRP